MGRMLDALKRLESRHATNRRRTDRTPKATEATTPTCENISRTAAAIINESLKDTGDSSAEDVPLVASVTNATDGSGEPPQTTSANSPRPDTSPCQSNSVEIVLESKAVVHLQELSELMAPARWVSPGKAGGAETMLCLERSFEIFEHALGDLLRDTALSRKVPNSPARSFGSEVEENTSTTSACDAVALSPVHWVAAWCGPLLRVDIEDDSFILAHPSNLHWSVLTDSAQATPFPEGEAATSRGAATSKRDAWVLTIDHRAAAPTGLSTQSEAADKPPEGCQAGVLRTGRFDSSQARSLDVNGAQEISHFAATYDEAEEARFSKSAEPPFNRSPSRRHAALGIQKDVGQAADEDDSPPTIRFPGSVRSGTPSRRTVSKLRAIPHWNAYGRLCDHLTSLLESAGWQSIGLTGAAENDGQITVAEALCRLWAVQEKGEVLAIDAYPQPYGLAHRLGCDDRSGLAEILWGRLGWQKAINRSLIEGLYVLPAGECEFPADADVEDCWPKLLAQWRLEFRYIVVNIGRPPIAPQGVLGRHCDGVVFVARPRCTHRRDARRCVDHLQKKAARLIATVVVDEPDVEYA